MPDRIIDTVQGPPNESCVPSKCSLQSDVNTVFCDRANTNGQENLRQVEPLGLSQDKMLKQNDNLKSFSANKQKSSLSLCGQFFFFYSLY